MNDVEKIVPASGQLEGAGFEVRRPIPSEALSSLGPFILLDHLGPATIKPGEAVGAPTSVAEMEQIVRDYQSGSFGSVP